MASTTTTNAPIFLLTAPRTCSNLLARILSPGTQPTIAPHANNAYFFFAVGGLPDRDKSPLGYSPAAVEVHQERYQKCADALAAYLKAGEKEPGKRAFVKEHVEFMISLDTQVDFLRGVQAERPFTVTMPGFGSERSRGNETIFPDAFVKTWKPVFLIRHPAVAFASQWRANRDVGFLCGDGVDVDAAKLRINFRWSKNLYSFLKEQGEESPIVVDADDIISNPSVMSKLASLLGFDESRLKLSWPSMSKEEIAAKLPDFRMRRWQDTLLASEGVQKDKVAGEIDIDVEVRKWKEEFGELQAVILEGLVRESMGDYEYLKERRLRA